MGGRFFMENDKNTVLVRCNNPDVHRKNGDGSVLTFMRGNSIFIKCQGYEYVNGERKKCDRWTRLIVTLPGVDIDFAKAGLVQKAMPKGYHFDAIRAPTIIEVT